VPWYGQYRSHLVPPLLKNPRLIIALIAVMDAQKINGTVILKSYDVSDQTTSKEDR